MQSNRWLQALIVLLVIIASTWLAAQVWSFLIQFSNVILLFFLAWLLAFILRPIAKFLTGRGLPYAASVGIVYLVLAIFFTLAGFLLVPLITQQIEQLIRNYNSYLSQFAVLVADGERLLRSWGMRDVDLSKMYSDIASQVQGVVPTVLQNTLSIFQSVATLVLQTILIFLLSFYFMKDGERIGANILSLLPPRWQDELRLVALSFEKSFGGFIRGQAVFALVYGALTAVVMLMPPFQLEYVLIASIVAGLCMIIPLVGNFLAFAPPMLVCLVTPDKAGLWPWLLLALFIMQSIMMNFLGPRIMSSAIGIHPLYVVGAMLFGAQIAGFWGALFGIPIAGGLNLIGRPIMRRIRHQVPMYREIEPSGLSTRAFITGPLAATLAEQSPLESRTEETVVPVAATQPHAVVTSEPAVAAAHYDREASPSISDFQDDEDEVMAKPTPTMSARVMRTVFVLGSRAITRAWGQARQIKAPRQQ